MTTLTGASALAKIAGRRDRVLLAIWLYAFAALVGASVYGFRKLYPTTAGRVEFVTTANHNSALLSIYGPFYGTSLGSFTAWRDTTLSALLAGLMSIFIVVRHTRADEESGRLELVRSAVVGRQAALAAAVLIALGANLTIGVAMVVVAVALGLPVAGSVALAAGVAGCGLVFAGVAAITAQIAQTARAARGLAVGVIAAAFLLRAVGDSAGTSGPRWLTWLSPVGWAELSRAFGSSSEGTRWWLLALPVAAAVVLVAGAARLAAGRDYDTGVLPQRPGPGHAAASLRSPLALAWRLQRASVTWWATGALVYGFVVGSAARGIGGLLGSAQVKRIMTRLGGHAGLEDAYLAAILGFTGLAVAAFAISAVLRLRSEETELLAEPVLATRVGRTRWALSHLTVATAGTVVILAVAGVGAGLGYGARRGSLGSEVATLAGAALVQAPAALVLAGVAVALFGLAPRTSVTASWSVLGAVVAMLFVGATLQLSHWVLDLSPFTHVPKLPGGAVSGAPLVFLCLIAVALAGAGLAGLRRRDIG